MWKRCLSSFTVSSTTDFWDYRSGCQKSVVLNKEERLEKWNRKNKLDLNGVNLSQETKRTELSKRRSQPTLWEQRAAQRAARRWRWADAGSQPPLTPFPAYWQEKANRKSSGSWLGNQVLKVFPKWHGQPDAGVVRHARRSFASLDTVEDFLGLCWDGAARGWSEKRHLAFW